MQILPSSSIDLFFNPTLIFFLRFEHHHVTKIPLLSLEMRSRDQSLPMISK